jgi:restriction system protein
MTIPDYETLMLPVLQACGDGREHRTPDLVGQMADLFRLSEDERAALLPSGRQAVIANRTHWAITYMAQAGLLERTRRGFVRLTDRGREVLARAPGRLDDDFLMQFPEFLAFRRRSRGAGRGEGIPTSTEPRATLAEVGQTPEERLRSAAAELEAALRAELLDRIRKLPPDFFERAVVQLLVAMGYGSDLGGTAAAIGRSGDGGLDGMIDQDPLGLDRVYVQAKRYAADNPVGSPAILQFSGALAQRGATRGVFITTSRFTEDARATAARLPQRIVLVDGEELARLMIRHDVGVRIAETVHVKRIDEDFFLEE